MGIRWENCPSHVSKEELNPSHSSEAATKTSKRQAESHSVFAPAPQSHSSSRSPVKMPSRVLWNEEHQQKSPQTSPFLSVYLLQSHLILNQNFVNLKCKYFILKNGLIVGNSVSLSYNQFKNRFKLI